jgi:hypothetical protein
VIDRASSFRRQVGLNRGANERGAAALADFRVSVDPVQEIRIDGYLDWLCRHDAFDCAR